MDLPQRVVRLFDDSLAVQSATRDALAPDLVERVEFIKGPASAVYGKNAIGGVINVTRSTPSYEGFSGSARPTGRS